jgi:hypothetical protein
MRAIILTALYLSALLVAHADELGSDVPGFGVHAASAGKIQRSIAFYYTGRDQRMNHRLGHSEGDSWVADAKHMAGFMTYGPRANYLPAGVTTAEFNLRVDDNQSNDAIVARLEAYDARSRKVLSQRIITRRDFAGTAAQGFDIEFEIPENCLMEFRVYTFGNARLQQYFTKIIPEQVTLNALWDHSAHFEYFQRDQFLSESFHDGFTSSLIAIDGVWYAFNRMPETSPTKRTSECNKAGRPPLKVVVRSSTDLGATWTNPTTIVTPSPTQQSADYCEVVDGSAFFDGQTDTWHYLGQCINATDKWNMCHYSLRGSTPTRNFVPDPINPVVLGGALWSEICRGTGKACPSTMQDEGTPQILQKDLDGFFYVTFHGANYGVPVTGARGVARTKDFEHWEVSGLNLPNDALLSIQDCMGWRITWAKGGCIGEGNARILRSGGYFYMLAEAADLGLTCQSGQQWVIGLLRNLSLGVSGSWQSFDSNPFIVNQHISPVGCALQYMNLIRDRGEIYLEVALYTPDREFPSYFYHLVDGRGNSDVLEIK